MPIKKTHCLGVLILSANQIWAQNCAFQQNSLASIQLRVQSDENAIRRVNPALQSISLQDWATAAEDEKRKILSASLKDSGSLLAGKALETSQELASYALQPATIAGTYLQNGIGSIGTAQGQHIVSVLEQDGADQTLFGKSLIGLIQQASSTTNKRLKLQILSETLGFLNHTKDIKELTTSEDSVDAAATAFQIAADLAGRLQLSVAIEVALFNGVRNLSDAYVISRATKSLGTSVEQQLKAINALNIPLKDHVAQLQQAKAALTNCQSANSANTQQGTNDGFDAQLKALSDRINQDSAAAQKCTQAQISCNNSCQDPGWGNCIMSCASVDRSCEKPLVEDEWKASHAEDELMARHFASPPKQQ